MRNGGGDGSLHYRATIGVKLYIYYNHNNN